MYLFPGDHAKLDPIINNMSSAFGASTGIGGGLGMGSSGNGSTSNSSLSDINSAWAVTGVGGLNDSLDDHSSNGGSAGGMGAGVGGGGSGNKAKRSISTKVRMLVKDMRSSTQTSANNDTNSMDQKPKYEEVVLIAAPVKGEVIKYFIFK